jgi:mycothiol synthase
MKQQDYIPKIDGLSFRTYEGTGDLLKMVEIHKNSQDHDRIDPLSVMEYIPTVKDLESRLHNDHASPTRDLLIVELDDQVIGYSKVGWWTEAGGTWLYIHTGFLVPEWRGKGIGTAMLHWSQERIRTIASDHDTKGKGMFGSNATDSEIEKTKLLLDDGYHKVFTTIEMDFGLSQSVPDIAIPDGFEVREVKPEHLRMIWKANNSVYSSRDFIREHTEDGYQEFANNPKNDYSLWQVAWHGDEIAGFVLSEVDNEKGEILEVSTVEKYRRKGLAQALLVKNISLLKERGVKVIRLHTSGEDVAGARTLYEKIGFRHIKDHVRYRKPLN